MFLKSLEIKLKSQFQSHIVGFTVHCGGVLKQNSKICIFVPQILQRTVFGYDREVPYLCSTQCAFNLIHPHSYEHIFCAFYLTVIHTLVHALESNLGLASCLRLFGMQTGVYRDPKSNIPVSK